MTFAVDDKVELLCKVLKDTELSVTAQWVKERSKKILETANFSYDAESESAYYRFHHVIDKVSTSDAGMYTCVANFSFGLRQASYNLRVRGKQPLVRLISNYCKIRPQLVC